MKLRMFQVDAFTARVFRGNPAAVVPLEKWLPDETLGAIAAENNLSETAFYCPAPDAADADYHLRWFTPTVEVDLCGHATLATAHVLWNHVGCALERLRFYTPSGVMAVGRAGDRLVLDFPARSGVPAGVTAEVSAALGAAPQEVRAARDLLAVFGSEEEIRALRPDFARVAALEAFAVIVTAPGLNTDVDFVSRFFAPRVGIAEDPVTGSAHCTLVPYWAARLGRSALHALQVSARGGELFCKLSADGQRVHIGGQAATYLEGSIEI